MRNKSMKLETDYFIEVIAGDEVFVSQMANIGIFRGEQIQVLTQLPFEGPVIVKTEASVFALRKEDFQCLKLKPK